MRVFTVAGVVAVVLAFSSVGAEPPKPPVPQKEHEWLKQLEGQWEVESEGVTEPGKPPVKCRGTDAARSLGGLWLVSEMKATVADVPVTGVMTLGYDAQKKKVVGTWVCSMCDVLYKYEGALEGQTLTLETEGPNPSTGKLVKMRDVIELKDKDTKVLTSSMLGEDGKWVPFMTMTGKRKK
ncbi:hypothetical protein VT84_25485 [Gemmata sp. SH-PL17]|uniref:DUF1579 domain-containing protein n=1 Tax=Gemmata sp. SH-PL17 TaxID=1630693 RepID=UPI0004B65211|nr:DUF1579 domain-containing protein [Gemmata sp. SH-PL17]AMV27780.1 hypothetical protein VT84_25485 [Gemmata sp. SH-PL17]